MQTDPQDQEPNSTAPDSTGLSVSPTDAADDAPSKLEMLAQIADLDVRLEQIAHHLAHLPERATRTEQEAELDSLNTQAGALDAQIADLERQQRRLEDEVALVEAKRSANSERLHGSQLTSPKEATALFAEAESLQARQTEIEDQILDLMEQLEPLGDDSADLNRRQAAVAERIKTIDAKIADAEQEAATQRSETLSARAALVSLADPAQVDVYEKRYAAARGGSVLGRLTGTTCTACHLALASTDYEHIIGLEPDELTDCPQCGALLVR